MKKQIPFLLLTLMLGHSALAVDIEIRALFGGAAMIAIDGKSQLLKVGERSVEGIELVSADAEKAVVEYKGEKLTITLSDRIASSFTQADQATVMINMNKN
ncbi:MAG: TIGR02281 family clan AA aspartic protease, partial [Gammaproteobacteria bacterium]|nr:TIGR02281 family clan AA aspartic protease [Gammaproteobacteria bacterium]